MPPGDGPVAGRMLPFRAVTARSEAPASYRSSAVRPGFLELMRIGITEVLSRRRLITWLVRADLKKAGTDTLLGNIWWILDPLLQMLIYVVLVSIVFSRGYPDYPVFVFAAILPWKWFQSAVQDGSLSVVLMERLIKQINFPKIVLPWAAVIAGVANFAFGMIPLVAILLVFYADRASLWLLAIPLIAVVQLIFSLAVATVLAAANVFYRDIGNLARHLLRFWFYLSPALYGLDRLAEITKKHPYVGDLMNLNPFTVLFESYRDVIYYKQPPEWMGLLILGIVSCGLLLIALVIFKRVEPMFAKVL